MIGKDWAKYFDGAYLSQIAPSIYIRGDSKRFLEEFKCEFLSEQERNRMVAKIIDVEMVVKDKVVEVTFDNGDKQKSVCREPDVFSLEMAISICITKHLLGGSGPYNQAVRAGLRYYEDKLRKEKAEAEEKERIKKREAKLVAWKNRCKEKRKEAQIEMQKEAYLRALRDFNKELSEASCK